jgi:hypothetical protein
MISLPFMLVIIGHANIKTWSDLLGHGRIAGVGGWIRLDLVGLGLTGLDWAELSGAVGTNRNGPRCSAAEGQGRRVPMFDWLFINSVFGLTIDQYFIFIAENSRGGGGTFAVLP